MSSLLEICQIGAACIFLAAMAWAAWSDLSTFEIANWVPVTVVLAYGVAALGAGRPLAEAGLHLSAGAAVLIAAAALFFLNLLGGADAKLLAAVAVWSGWEGLAGLLFLVVLAGGALALGVIGFRALPLSPRPGWRDVLRPLHDRGQGLPYGVAIAAAAIVSAGRWPAFPALWA